MTHPNASDGPIREVRFEHSRRFAEILQQLQVSLLVSTYQAGKLVVIGQCGGKVQLSFQHFDQAMGVAIHPQRIAVGGRSQIWFLESTPDIVTQLGGETAFDACYLARSSYVTEEIHVHDMQWCDDELWLVNTKFSCLCTLATPYSFVPRWRPPFISSLAAEDRCHLNGLCAIDGQPRYVTAMSETDIAEGWRPTKATSGCLIDVTTGETVYRGFAMPHSPRYQLDRLWVLDSGRGQLVTVDPQSGDSVTVSAQPGYTRGLDFAGPYAFIGLSRIRESSTFGGVPIAEMRDQLKCGVAIVDVRTGSHLAHFEFISGVEEIYDVRVLSTAENPRIAGPMAVAQGEPAIWYAPPVPNLTSRLQIDSHTLSPTAANEAASQLSHPLAPPTGRIAANSPSINRETGDTSSSQPPHVSHSKDFQRGTQLAESDQYEDAAQCFRNCIAQDPHFVHAYWNLGVALHCLKLFPDALHAFDQALAIDPQLPAAHLNRAMTLFAMGRFDGAWQEYVWRWRCPRFAHRKRPRLAPEWSDLHSSHGNHIVVYAEQGVGDEIMFASQLPALAQYFENITVACDPRLVQLFSRSFPGLDFVAHEGGRFQVNDRDIQCQIAMGELPRIFNPILDHAHARDKYIVCDPITASDFEARLSEFGEGVRIGISWRGGGDPIEARRRSTRLSQWECLLSQAGCQFVDLQYGSRDDELKDLSNIAGKPLIHFRDVDPLVDLERFAALIANLDLVVTIDNSTAHLAAAMGVPTWILCGFPSASHWRWGMMGEQTAWYRSARLFRRSSTEDWSSVLQRVCERIVEQSNSATSST